jgi:hypothetical protein
MHCFDRGLIRCRLICMSMRRCGGLALAVLFVGAVGASAQQPAVAGRVKTASGDAVIVRQAGEVAAKVGAVLFEADSLRTGADGRLGVTLTDDTRISLGPGSEVRLTRYAYAPDANTMAFVMRVVRGVAAYVSGRIAKLSPESVRLETPTSVVGVRGTRVLIRVEAP